MLRARQCVCAWRSGFDKCREGEEKARWKSWQERSSRWAALPQWGMEVLVCLPSDPPTISSFLPQFYGGGCLFALRSSHFSIFFASILLKWLFVCPPVPHFFIFLPQFLWKWLFVCPPIPLHFHLRCLNFMEVVVCLPSDPPTLPQFCECVFFPLTPPLFHLFCLNFMEWRKTELYSNWLKRGYTSQFKIAYNFEAKNHLRADVATGWLGCNEFLDVMGMDISGWGGSLQCYKIDKAICEF